MIFAVSFLVYIVATSLMGLLVLFNSVIDPLQMLVLSFSLFFFFFFLFPRVCSVCFCGCISFLYLLFSLFFTDLWWRWLVGWFGFYGIATIVGCFMLNPTFTYVLNIYGTQNHFVDIFLNEPEFILLYSQMVLSNMSNINISIYY